MRERLMPRTHASLTGGRLGGLAIEAGKETAIVIRN